MSHLTNFEKIFKNSIAGVDEDGLPSPSLHNCALRQERSTQVLIHAGPLMTTSFIGLLHASNLAFTQVRQNQIIVQFKQVLHPHEKKKNFSPTSFYFLTCCLVSWAYVKFFAQICEATKVIIFEIRPAW
jgi:hypothetical protein